MGRGGMVKMPDGSEIWMEEGEAYVFTNPTPEQLMLQSCQKEVQRLQKQIRALLTVIELLGEKEHADKATP